MLVLFLNYTDGCVDVPARRLPLLERGGSDLAFVNLFIASQKLLSRLIKNRECDNPCPKADSGLSLRN